MRKELRSFSPATCASEKISHRRAGNPCVGQPVFSVLFALFSLAGVSPPASKRTKIPRKSKAVRCEAVLPEQKCSQTRKRPQRILCVFSRALTQHEGISARQNRVCPCQSTQAPENQNIFFKREQKALAECAGIWYNTRALHTGCGPATMWRKPGRAGMRPPEVITK